MFHTKVVEKIKTHISRSVTFFPENRAIYEIIWKSMVEPGRQATDDNNMANAH
jgi:hypothetical protein